MPKRATRRNKRATRRNPKKFHVVSRAMALPIFAVNSAGHVVKGVTKMAGKIAKHSFKGVKNIGQNVARSANTALNKTFGKRTTRRK
jgi:hypothetical protein